MRYAYRRRVSAERVIQTYPDMILYGGHLYGKTLAHAMQDEKQPEICCYYHHHRFHSYNDGHSHIGGAKMPLIGETAPSFEAVTTQGPIRFPEDYAGKWVILFSHPADFTPVCTTEFMTFASMADEFAELNTELIGLSVDSLYAHIAWLRKIQELEWNGKKNIEVKFPLIEDIRMEVANKFGMIQPGQSNTQAVRAVFVIDPSAKIRTILYYSLSTGRNFDEIKRIILALQKADSDQVATPADWRPGDDVIVPTAGSCGTAKERMESTNDDQYCLDWFMCFRREKT